ncbi:hypothetical protein ABKA04_002948 [Annulohypoxylon sp. FPYF3050]
MMLTSKQPVHHGYRPVHDLPTPPRSSPPLSIQDPLQKQFLALPQKQSPSTKPMSAPHRGLPLPAAMTLAQPPPPPAPGPPHPPAPGPPLHSQGPPVPSPHSQSLGALPPPPHQSSEESMRSWLVAKAEEERRRQEEEKTRQEGLRLEQRRLEYDMLRTSLDRGIPPPMVPVVFAGMSGGVLPQAALEWAQQYLMPQQAHAAQIMPSQGGLSPETRRESQQYGGQQYGVPSTPGSGTGAQASFVPYPGPGSPRPRAHTLSMSGGVGRPLGGSALPRLSTSEGPGGPSGIPHPAHWNHLRNEKRPVLSSQRLHRAKRGSDHHLLGTEDQHYPTLLQVDDEAIPGREVIFHPIDLRDVVELNLSVLNEAFHLASGRREKLASANHRNISSSNNSLGAVPIRFRRYCRISRPHDIRRK